MPKRKEDTTRGFANIVGKTINSIDTHAINDVTITFTDGSKYSINGDEMHCGIPVLECLDVYHVAFLCALAKWKR